MAVRLRKWTTAQGEDRKAWVVDYIDGRGKRRLKTFPAGEGQERKARDFEAKTRVDIRKGVHVADSTSITVAEAGRKWLERLEAIGREKSTIECYRGFIKNHIEPALGRLKLSQLDALLISDFEDALLRKANNGRGRSGTISVAMVQHILTTLGTLIADAQERGLVSHNIVKERRRRIINTRKSRLEVGQDIPTIEEVRSLLAEAKPGLARTALATLVFTGLRSSELRGLRWKDIDLDRRTLRVQQRVDKFQEIGPPKSRAGVRSIPLPPLVVNTLKEWRLQCPTGAELCFATQSGKPMRHSSFLRQVWMPALRAAGLEGKYTGLHALRHFYASWCINPVEAGGLGLSPKAAQERLGHSSITMTLDTYGHLFPATDDAEALAAAERRLLG